MAPSCRQLSTGMTSRHRREENLEAFPFVFLKIRLVTSKNEVDPVDSQRSWDSTVGQLLEAGPRVAGLARLVRKLRAATYKILLHAFLCKQRHFLESPRCPPSPLRTWVEMQGIPTRCTKDFRSSGRLGQQEFLPSRAQRANTF